MWIRFDLKVGDSVVVASNKSWEEPYSIKTVTKLTKTQATLSDGNKYMLTTGHIIETYRSYSSPSMVQHRTPEEALLQNKEWASMRTKKDLVSRLNALDYGKCSDEQLVKIKEILKEQIGDIKYPLTD